jgi:hypothetical protein
LSDNLARLLATSLAADTTAVLGGARHPAHRAILYARCPALRPALLATPGHGGLVDFRPFALKSSGGDDGDCQRRWDGNGKAEAEVLEAVLTVIYTGGAAFLTHPTSAAAPVTNSSLPVSLGLLSDTLGALGCTWAAPPVTTDGSGAASPPLSPPPPPSLEHLVGEGGSALVDLELEGVGHGGAAWRRRCHSAVLVAGSGFFRAVLGRDWAPPDGGTRVVHVEGPDGLVMDGALMDRVLAEMYTGRLALPDGGDGGDGGGGELADQATAAGLELLRAASFLDAPSLSRACCRAVAARSLSPTTLAALWDLADGDDHAAPLARACAAYAARHFGVLLRSGAPLLGLPAGRLRAVLSSDRLAAREADVLAAAMRWGVARCAEDPAATLLAVLEGAGVLELVRLPFVRLPAHDGGQWVGAAAEAWRYGLLSSALLGRARQLLQRNRLGSLTGIGSLLGSSPFYTMRLYPELPAGLRSELARRALEQERAEQWESRDRQFNLLRMFHPVNGRDHFAPLAPPAAAVDLAKSLGASLPTV